MAHNDTRQHPSESIPNDAYPDSPFYQPGTGGGTPPTDNNSQFTTSYPSTTYPSNSIGSVPRPWSPSQSQLHDPPPPYIPSNTNTSSGRNRVADYDDHASSHEYHQPSYGGMSNIPLQHMATTHQYSQGGTPPMRSYGGALIPKPVGMETPGSVEAEMRRRRRRKVRMLVGGIIILFLFALLVGIGIGVVRKKFREHDDDDD